MAHIRIKNASVEFPIYHANARSIKNQFIRISTGGKVMSDASQHLVVKALDNISVNIEHGDRVGLVGHNGAGKSTLLKLMADIYEPTRGTIDRDGKVSPLLNIMQGIETESTGYENIVMRGICLGLTRKQIKAKVDEIAEFTGLGSYLAMPTRTYSSGMQIRLAFGIATSIEPEILLIDEVFGAGDADFMQKARNKMVELLSQSSIVVFASHANDLIAEFCNKAILMDGGKVIAFGKVNEILELYQKQHPHN